MKKAERDVIEAAEHYCQLVNDIHSPNAENIVIALLTLKWAVHVYQKTNERPAKKKRRTK